MFVIGHLPTTALLFHYYKSKKTKQNNHTCTIESTSAPFENIWSAETTVLKHKGKFSSSA